MVMASAMPKRADDPRVLQIRELRQKRIEEAKRLDAKAFDAWVAATAQRLARR